MNTVQKICSAAVMVFASAFPAMAEKLSLDAISNYINSLTTAQTRFTQINEDGSVSTGDLYIKRPGKIRFEYDPPNAALVLAEANAVAIFDRKSNQPPETYPLRRTPLSLLLARDVDLGTAKMVVAHDYDGSATIVAAQDPKKPEYGTIQMFVTDAPVRLQKWVITNSTGGQTTVVLDELKTGMSLSNELFSFSRAQADKN